MESIALDSIRLTHVHVPFSAPFATHNVTVHAKDAVLVEIKAGGLTGLGEASPLAGVPCGHHTIDATWRSLTERLVPHLAQVRELDLSGEWFAGLVDDPYATCGLDMALWDLAARKRNQPLWSLLGGRGDRTLEAGLVVGTAPTADELIERISRHLANDGYRRVKVYIKPGWDLEPLEAIRIRFGRIPLMADGCGTYTREHIPHLAAFDRFSLLMIEQPLPRDDLEGHAELSARSRTPICLDDSVESPEAVARAVRLRAAQIVSLRLQRLGGFAAALRIHAMTHESRVGCWMGSMPELGVSAHASMHFATLPGITHPADVCASHRWFTTDVTEPAVGCHNGLLGIPPGAGLGIRLNNEVVRAHKIRDFTEELHCKLTGPIPVPRLA